MEADGDPSVEEYKRKGNDAFKEGNWDEALKNYNKAISLDGSKAALYSNRAACWSSKGSHDNALKDADRCLERDPNFVKGYSRKGKALFDLYRFDEAEAAYKQGLTIEPNNDTCTQGLVAVKSAKARAKAGSGRSSSSSSFGGMGQISGILGSLRAKMKGSGRLKMYVVVMVGYFLYNKVIKGGLAGGKGASDSGSLGSAVNEAAASTQASMQLTRGFTQVAGAWISHLEAGGDADTQLVLLHRTASSAEAEFGSAIKHMLEADTDTPSFRVLAPDRPCHGFSPCASSNGAGGAWLHKLVRRRPSPSLVIVASGRESMLEALRLARSLGSAARLLLLSPTSTSPTRPLGEAASAADLKGWLNSLPSENARDIASAAMWAAEPGADAGQISGNLAEEERLPDGVGATIIYTSQDVEDSKLKASLEDLGADVSIRRIQSLTPKSLSGEVKHVLQETGGDVDVESSET